MIEDDIYVKKQQISHVTVNKNDHDQQELFRLSVLQDFLSKSN